MSYLVLETCASPRHPHEFIRAAVQYAEAITMTSRQMCERSGGMIFPSVSMHGRRNSDATDVTFTIGNDCGYEGIEFELNGVLMRVKADSNVTNLCQAFDRAPKRTRLEALVGPYPIV